MFDLQNAILALDSSTMSVDQVYDLNELCPTNEELEMLTVHSALFFLVLVCILSIISIHKSDGKLCQPICI